MYMYVFDFFLVLFFVLVFNQQQSIRLLDSFELYPHP